MLKQSLPCVRTTDTNNDKPKAPSQATKVKKNKVKYTSCEILLDKSLTHQKTFNITNSKLNKALSKCLRWETNVINPQNILITGTTKTNIDKFISFNSLNKILVL